MSTTELMNRWLRERYAMPQTDEQSALIADILYHTYGDNAAAMLDQVDRYAIGWNESLHPRAQDGKFTGKGGRSGAQFLDASGKPSNISRHYDPQQVAAKRQAVEQQRPTEEQFLQQAAEQFRAAGGDTKTRAVRAKIAKLEEKRAKLGEKAEAKRAAIAAKVFPDQKEATKLEAKKDKLRAAVEQKKAARHRKLQADIESETQAIFNEYQGRIDKAESEHLKALRELRDKFSDDEDYDTLQEYLQQQEQDFADEVEEIEQERDEFVDETISDLRDAFHDDIQELDGDLENDLDDLDGEIEYFLDAAEKARVDALDELNDDIENEDADLEYEIEQFQARLQELTDDAISDLSDQLQEAESEQFTPIEERQYDEDYEVEYRAETRQSENEALQQQFADMAAYWEFGDRDWQEEEAEFLQRARQLMAARMKEDRSLTQQHANYFLQVARERYAAKFDEHKHKRDAAGRFAKKNESVAAIHDAIKTALSGGQHSPESVQGLADNLSQLTVRELTDLKKQYGISAAGRSKADLVAKVADRLSRGRREAGQQQPEPKPDPEPDVYAPESLFSINQGLVNALASKMGGQHEQDELRQVGRIALWKASQQWKPDSGTKFSTFAYTGIAQAIKNAQRTEGRQKSKAQEFGVDEEGGDQSQQVPGRDSAPDEDMEKQEQLGQLQDAMQQLQSKSPDAAKMVMMKFSGRKLSEIAAEFGITEQGASQAVNRAVKKLQTMMGADKMQRTGDIVRYMDAWIRERYAIEQHDEQAALIADILAHVYGDDAADILDAPDQYSLPQQMDMWIRERYGRQWDESQVKRDEKGRFATRAGKLANVASSIQNALQQPKTPQSAKALADELSQLTVKELTDLKKQYQIAASGRTKADLVQKLASRLDMGRREEQQPQRPEMADPAETLDADFVDDYFNGDMGAAIEAMERNRAEQISTAAKRGVEYDTDEIDADWMAEVAGMADDDEDPEPQPKPAKPPANLLGDDDDEPFVLQQPRKGRKQEKFETAPSGPQKALFDTGKNDLKGQNLLFNTDAGAGEDDPTTMENRMKGKAKPADKPPSKAESAKTQLRANNDALDALQAEMQPLFLQRDELERESREFLDKIGEARYDEPLRKKLHRRQNHVNRKLKSIGEKLQPLKKTEAAIRDESLQLIDTIRKADKLQSTIPRDRYSHLSPRGERIERLVAMVAAGFEQFVNMAGASGSGVPLLSQPPTPINPWNAAYAGATNQDPDKQLSRYSFKESDHPRDDAGKFAEKAGGGTGGSTDSFLAEFNQKLRKDAVSSTAAALMDEYDTIVRDYAEENVGSYTDDEGAVDFQSLATDAIHDLDDGDAVKHAANMLAISDPKAYQELTIEFGEHLKDHLDDEGLWSGTSQPNYDVEPMYTQEYMKEFAAQEYDAQADEMAAAIWQEYGPDLTDWAEENIGDYTDEDGEIDFESLAADAVSDIDRDTRYGGLLDLLANLESDGNQMLIDRIDAFLRPKIADFDIEYYERKSSGWITLNAEDGEGTKVYIGEGGKVTAGPKGMTGKTLSGDKPKKSSSKKRDDADDADDADPFNAHSRSEAATDADDDWRFEKHKIPWQARKAVDEVAERWGVDADDMIPLAQEKLQTELANWETREAVKKHARKSLGLNSRVTSDMENSRSKRGEDFANLSGLDEFLTEAQDMYPDFNWGDDPAQNLMDAVHEGAKPKPKLHDRAILDSAARYLFQTGQVAEAVPFSMLKHFPRTRYSHTVAFDSFCDEFLENALKSLTS